VRRGGEEVEAMVGAGDPREVVAGEEGEDLEQQLCGGVR
jgi:hypothetical protein